MKPTRKGVPQHDRGEGASLDSTGFRPEETKVGSVLPTDSVSPCWRLKNVPARVEESRCSPQCCSRMAKILPGVLTSSARMDSIPCLARPSSAQRSQAAAAVSTMGPSSRNNFASLTKSSASPSSPENRRSLWGLKLCSIGGAGGWPGLSAGFMVKIGLCCCLCEDRSRVSCVSADPDRSAKLVMELWSVEGQDTGSGVNKVETTAGV